MYFHNMNIVFNEIWDSKKPFGHCLTLKREGANGLLQIKKEFLLEPKVRIYIRDAKNSGSPF